MYEQQATGVYLQTADMDTVIGRLGVVPVFLNDLDSTTETGRKRIEELTRSSYDSDQLNILPSCEEGCTTGRRYLNTRCQHCQTIVVSVTERPIQSDVWIRPPRGVHAMMVPNVWTMLSEACGSRDFSLLEWITVPNTPTPPRHLEITERLKSKGLKRGWNYFVENFDFVIQLLTEDKGCMSKEDRAYVRQFVAENRHLIFTKYLPIPNKIAFITEKTNVGIYADGGMISGQDAINTIGSIDETEGGDSQLVRENKTVKTIIQLAAYYDRQTKTVLGKKSGWFRKQIFGTRVGYGGRAVITSLSGVHDYDELHIPWTFAVAMLKVHLTNKMLALGWTPIEIERYLVEKAQVYDPFLDSIFDELLAECPFKGLPCTFQRNPSLHRGSMQMLYITKIKKDPQINTISMSVLILKGPNADFDGDMLNLMLLLDRRQHDAMSRMAPHLTVFSLQTPEKVDGVTNIPGPDISTWNAWLLEEQEGMLH